MRIFNVVETLAWELAVVGDHSNLETLLISGDQNGRFGGFGILPGTRFIAIFDCVLITVFFFFAGCMTRNYTRLHNLAPVF